MAYSISSSLAVGSRIAEISWEPQTFPIRQNLIRVPILCQKCLFYLDSRPLKAPPKIILQDCWHALMVHMKYNLSQNLTKPNINVRLHIYFMWYWARYATFLAELQLFSY